jgi:hypothetical protein
LVNGVFDLVPQGSRRNADLMQHRIDDAFRITQEREQDVLRLNGLLIAPLRLLDRTFQGVPRFQSQLGKIHQRIRPSCQGMN